MVGPETRCEHGDLLCVNPYELIRKYRCSVCGAVMMCTCDQEFGERFLPHHLVRGRDLDTGLDVPVTIGFQPRVCRTCRGLQEEPHPKAQQYGRSSKVVRYYWREIFFATTRRFALWATENGYQDHRAAHRERPDKYAEVEAAVIEQIKDRHRSSPKYVYSEESAAQLLARCSVDVLDLKARYINGAEGHRQLVTPLGAFDTPEDVAASHVRSMGFDVLDCESRPFHVLFGVYMWLLIQDPADPLRYLAGFGDRAAFDTGQPGQPIWTFLPGDFGKPGYVRRRSAALEEHFALLDDDLPWLFDYWLEPSSELRQYLWAHRAVDVERARRILGILPADVLRRILRYLVESYWSRYTGWPDLIAYDATSYFFAEVKGSGDKLREDQKRWVRDNASVLHLPFKLVKVHRAPAAA